MNRVMERLKSGRVMERVIGYVLIFLVLCSVFISVKYANEQRRISECQVRVNQDFLAALKSNSRLAEADRANIARLVTDVAAGQRSPEYAAAVKRLQEAETPEEGVSAMKDIMREAQSTGSSRAALRAYLDRKAEIDAARKSYPAVPSDVCE